MSNPATLALLCVASYLLGAVPFGVLITRLFAKRDVREVGSGNIGATNVARAAGKAAGVATLVLDAAKAALPAYLGNRFFGPLGGALAGGAAFVGHVFPVYLRFRGGKGVAPGLGIFGVLAPWGAWPGLVVYLVVLAVTRTSALGSLASLVMLGIGVSLTAPVPVICLYVFVAFVVLARHRENVMELVARQRS